MNRALMTARMLRALCISGALMLLGVQTGAVAQSAVPNIAAPSAPGQAAGAPVVAGTGKNAMKPDVRPLWTELTPQQQTALAPLAAEWNKLDSNHKTKWLTISSKYAAMSPDKQQRFQENVRDWAKLTPEQHRIARESYARAKTLNPEQKTAQWQQYQQLPEEQKQKLAADAAAKKHIANPPSPQAKIKTVQPLKAANAAAQTHHQAVVPVTRNVTALASPHIGPASATTAPATPRYFPQTSAPAVNDEPPSTGK